MQLLWHILDHMADAGDFVVEGYEQSAEEPLPTSPEINVGTGYEGNEALRVYVESLISKGVLREGPGIMDVGVRMFVPTSSCTKRHIQRLTVDEFKCMLAEVGISTGEL